MSAEALKRLVGVAGALVVLWLGVTWLGGRASGSGPSVPGEVSGFFDGLEETRVDSVHILGPGRDVWLRRSAGAWSVNGFPADSAALARLWKAVGDAEIGGLMARNPANHERMGVDGDGDWSLEFFVGSEGRRLLVGRTGAQFGSAYVRLPDRDEVYLLEGGVRSAITRTLDDWRNKRLAAVDTSRVHRVDVLRDGEGYVLSRADSTWTLADGTQADEGGVDGILGELSDLRASGFLTATDSLAALAEGGRVLALGEDGDTLAVVRFGSGEADRWARVPGDSVLYRLPRWRLDRLAPGLERLKGS